MRRLIRWSAIGIGLILVALACLFLKLRFDFGQAAAVHDTGESGLTYTNQRVARVPWSIHVLGVDRSRSSLACYSTQARGTVLGVSPIHQQARSIPSEIGRAIAGVNGDFYERDDRAYAGDPRGLQIVNGELTSAPDSVCVWFDAEGNPHLDEVTADFTASWPDGRNVPFGLNERRLSSRAVLYTPAYGSSTQATGGQELILEKAEDGPWLPLQPSKTYRARVREVTTEGNTKLSSEIMVLSIGPRLVANLPETGPGTVLEISTATTPDLAGVPTAIGGGPALIQDGQVCEFDRPSSGRSSGYSERSKYERHPRSAIGWSSTHLYLVVVDGRQPGLSVGMTLAELAGYLSHLGCTDAMNFDGGVSAQMWLNGKIVNSPCRGDRTVANSLLVVRRAENTGGLVQSRPVGSEPGAE